MKTFSGLGEAEYENRIRTCMWWFLGSLLLTAAAPATKPTPEPPAAGPSSRPGVLALAGRGELGL